MNFKLILKKEKKQKTHLYKFSIFTALFYANKLKHIDVNHDYKWSLPFFKR